jgi:hypothetical protein
MNVQFCVDQRIHDISLTSERSFLYVYVNNRLCSVSAGVRAITRNQLEVPKEWVQTTVYTPYQLEPAPHLYIRG